MEKNEEIIYTKRTYGEKEKGKTRAYCYHCYLFYGEGQGKNGEEVDGGISHQVK
jgi:hypothetical protein